MSKPFIIVLAVTSAVCLAVGIPNFIRARSQSSAAPCVNTLRVIDVFGDALPGLYAAGEVVGGLHGAAYMTGSSLGKAAIFGRVAARSALAALK